jgi:hypothetical protein
MKPHAHAERYDSNTFHRMVDWDDFPEGSNCVYTIWRPNWKDRLRMLFGADIWIGQKTTQVTQRVVITKRLGAMK